MFKKLKSVLKNLKIFQENVEPISLLGKLFL